MFERRLTAKRFAQTAQGCRASRLPWELVLKGPQRRWGCGGGISLGCVLSQIKPRVAAWRGNPGLSYVTASRLIHLELPGRDRRSLRSTNVSSVPPLLSAACSVVARREGTASEFSSHQEISPSQLHPRS